MTPRQAVAEAMAIDGAQGAVLVDYYARMPLASAGAASDATPKVIATMDTDVLRAKLDAIRAFGYGADALEDIVVTLTDRIDVILPVANRDRQGVFLHLTLDRRADLAMSRARLRNIARSLMI
ncbi:hypothetical protein BIV57_16000 [Mangrovactinospora gilvigrisea]|uniref:Roadblock/LAMTOR2 domain-containing protein n=1 Tax=Mangrovactinospora gilvigrisea TaxID=1428644 RepID=A0A1J7BCX4_9ACTN|nr:hypothetical protein [Mangrovactinospora gilvigrisea]OIV36502.1 hypothetical protein BIV57_16000 [Mangrovactinospora gilvigrisea]